MATRLQRSGRAGFRTRLDRPRRALLASFAAIFAGWGIAGAETIEGITFATAPGKLYVPLDQAGHALGWRLSLEKSEFQLNSRPLETLQLRQLVDGTLLVPVDELEHAGALLVPVPGGPVQVIDRGHHFTATAGPKRVEVSLKKQQLRAWQGTRLVLESRISSGRRGSTPAGEFKAGPYKARMHYSMRYHNAPMPWSVQIRGHVFIHGFTSVPDYPASHGCIRLPLEGGNPARFFYQWIDRGTPVKVARD